MSRREIEYSPYTKRLANILGVNLRDTKQRKAFEDDYRRVQSEYKQAHENKKKER